MTFHWRKQAEEEKNGPNFHFLINNSSETEGHYTKQAIPESEPYHLSVSTVNEVGPSKEEFVFKVPSEESVQNVPEVKESLLVDNNGKFSLAWHMPRQQLSSDFMLTVFWCSGSSDSDCVNGIKWQDIAGDSTEFEIPEEDFVDFAFISLSQNNITRGMRIVPCRLSLGKR